MNGLDLLAMVVLVGLLLAWARQRGCDQERERVEHDARWNRRMRATLDRMDERDYREQLRIGLLVDDVYAELEEAA